jgi:hypothetical protein
MFEEINKLSLEQKDVEDEEMMGAVGTGLTKTEVGKETDEVQEPKMD